MNFPLTRRLSSNAQPYNKMHELSDTEPLNNAHNFEPLNMKEFSKRIGPRVSPTNYEPGNSVKSTLVGDGNGSMLQHQQLANAYKINGTNGTVTKQLDIYDNYKIK